MTIRIPLSTDFSAETSDDVLGGLRLCEEIQGPAVTGGLLGHTACSSQTVLLIILIWVLEP